MKAPSLATRILLAILASWILQSSALGPSGRIHAQIVRSFDDPDLLRLRNDHINVGFRRSSGGAIAWLSQADSNQNFVDSWDRGRLIQQSYYGDSDGSQWASKAWRYNPVQGGGYQGQPGKILDHKLDRRELTLTSRPIHWATGEKLPECEMRQTVRLAGPLVVARFEFWYRGDQHHLERDQEIPAVFVPSDFNVLVLYDGDHAWTNAPLSRSQPGWPNESRRITEHWAAYVNSDGMGLGVYVPVADKITCYRFGKQGAKGACSYFAPITRFAIEPGLHWSYDVYLTIGTIPQIRERFKRIAL